MATKTEKTARAASEAARAAEWNARYPPGTRVRWWVGRRGGPAGFVDLVSAGAAYCTMGEAMLTLRDRRRSVKLRACDPAPADWGINGDDD